ncbi:MAG: response regulator, partial [Candidatus Auribacterota bacterium]|nr:response regulator [Candidatus Auribacterota bacterium]
MKILLVDDEKTIRLTLTDSLRETGFMVKVLENGQDAKNILEQEKFDCVISDIRLPGIDGVSLLKFTKERFPDTEVILITAFGDVEQAVEAVKAGANDYIMKPFMNDEVILRLKKIAEIKRLKDENVKLKQQLVENTRFGELVGKSKQMRELFKFIETISKTDSSVLICGDSGTGKELVANSIHYNS